jgi:hypothetical protein
MYPTNLKQLLRSDAYAGLADAGAAALASTPTLTPRPVNVTFTTLGNVWGIVRAATFRAALDRMAGAPDPQAAAIATYAITVLSGNGFEPGHPQAQIAAGMLVQAGLCTADESRDSQFTLSYPAGDRPVTADDVKAARADNARDDALDAVEGRVRGVYAAFVNERLNPARSDPAAAVPAFAEFVAAAQAAGEGA